MTKKTIKQQVLEQEEETEGKFVAKELFKANKKEIMLKTDLDDKEIKVLSRLLYLKERYDLNSIDKFVNTFLKLRVSRKRKGRHEFLEAFKGELEKDRGSFDKFLRGR